MDHPSPASPVLASAIADALRERGVRRMFGIPGGGSSLALIDAAGRAGLDFVLTRTETAGAIMAAVTGELTGTPGVLLTGIGPGAASAVNGVAYAALEKSPLLLITDGPASSPHQALDQNALYAPVTKYRGRLQPGDGGETLNRALDLAMTPPWGPVQLDLTAGDATAPVTVKSDKLLTTKNENPLKNDIDAACGLIKASRRPVILAGLEARYADAPHALKHLADMLACPVLLTMKALGALPSSHPGYAGLFTGARAEAELIHSADLIIAFGLDPIEIIPGRWDYDSPLLDLCRAPSTPFQVQPACRATGLLAGMVEALSPQLEKSAWERDEIARARAGVAEAFALAGKGHTAQSVIEAAARVARPGTRLTVDAGAHMFATLAFWPAEEPFGVLKSNGLSTMGYALPAAIASSLEEPDRPVLAVTGDGGLMMCLGELTTAAERGCNITVIVINDAALSLIDIKQQRQQYQSSGVRYPGTDFAALAEAFGCRGWRVAGGADLASALREAFAEDGPALVDVICDAAGYGDQLARVRG